MLAVVHWQSLELEKYFPVVEVASQVACAGMSLIAECYSFKNSENFAREASSADALGLTARADPIISVLGTRQVANAPEAGFAVNLTPPQLVPDRTTSIQKYGASVRGRTITQHGV